MTTSTIEVCDVDITVPDGTIGINVSGGADSAILLYTLLSELPEREFHVYTMCTSTSEHRLINSQRVSKIIGEIISKIGYRNIQHHIKYMNLGDAGFTPEILHHQGVQAIEEGVIAGVFNSLTAAPPLELSVNFDTGDIDTIQEITVKRNPEDIARTVSRDGNIHMPLRNWDKTKVAELYEHYDVLEWLFPLTFSCENEDNDLNTSTHCGVCWWCQERMWAFNRLV